MIRHIIFDLDGTLVDSCDTCVSILTEMLEERQSSHVIDPIAARIHMSRGGVDMVHALLGPACGDPEQELLDFRTRYQERVTSPHALFSGVDESLARLRAAGLRLAICSNKPQNLCEKVLEDTGIAQLFDAIVGRRENLRPKPDPDLLHAVLAELDACAEECLFIGDSELDHQTAAALAMPFIFMTYGYAENGWQPTDCESYACFATMSVDVMDRARLAAAN